MTAELVSDDILAVSDAGRLTQTTPDISNEAFEEDTTQDLAIEKDGNEYEEIETKEAIEPVEAKQVDAEENRTVEKDDYGNEKEVLSKGMQKRLERLEAKQRAELESREHEIQRLKLLAEQHIASPSDLHEPSEASGDWQKDLKSFIKNTLAEEHQQRYEQERAVKERVAMQRFEEKLRAGVSQFRDFEDVVNPALVPDAVTYATRALEDPAGFLYSASKNHKDELQRISNLEDPYAQIVAVGKLDERMKFSKQSTKAPKPLSRTANDGYTEEMPATKEPSIEELIAQSDRKKQAKFNGRRR